MVIAHDHYQSIGISVSNQGALNVSRVSGRSASFLLYFTSDITSCKFIICPPIFLQTAANFCSIYFIFTCADDFKICTKLVQSNRHQ